MISRNILLYLILVSLCHSLSTEAAEVKPDDAITVKSQNNTAPFSSRLTLIDKSTGLSTPDKEEGNTEYEFADINGDGHLDLISVGDHGSPNINSSQHGIMVWLNNGAGTWTVHQSGNFGYGGCAIGDLDLDGHMDVAWGVHHNMGSAGFGDKLMGAARGDGTGSSWDPWGAGLADNGETWGMFATALADFDVDGLLDVVSQSFGGSNGLGLYKNNGNGAWTQAWSLIGGSVGFTLEACDINADGYPDILSTRSGTNILLGDGSFGFTVNNNGLPAGTIRGIHNGDMDLDGAEDIVFALDSLGVRCYTFEAGTGTWVSASMGLPTSGFYDLTQFGDFNNDGWLDIVVYSSPTGRIYLGDGSGNWTQDASWTMPAPGEASALRVDGDMDHDGREDIAVVASKSGFPFYRNQLRVYSPWQAPVELSARVTSPHGGETFRVGSIREIRWLAAVPSSQGQATVDIRLSHNSAAGPWTEVASGLPDNGRYQWVVDGYSTENARIKVVVTTPTDSITAQSFADFTLVSDTEPLEADISTLSEATGGSIVFSLHASSANAGRHYLLLGTATGTSPGFPLPGGMAALPLNWDAFTDIVLSLLNTPVFANFLNTLDSSGEAQAQIHSGPLPPGSAGVVMHYAYCLNNPFNFASNPVRIDIVP
ncbi:MAG: VCBS repeat-containing protein [Planctomycetota bacterium]